LLKIEKKIITIETKNKMNKIETTKTKIKTK